ncbi:MAG: HAD-IB family phosphatase [Candidatus Thermoplasmatota archaeon]|nr:HAD-IB family phosphatase [Candidatus Thermoplasmatota archaeon]MCL6089535.1 HAD-IB family phosphatase [Candidatus Thermoplasmatota archaeon]MDA8144421.1 HAD-IB family phosphatase [Thermoplasmatales archaeon]
MSEKKIRLAVFDMDGVLTQSSSSWDFVHRRLGVDNRENLRKYREDKISYLEFLRLDVGAWMNKLGTVPASMIREILDEIPLRDGIAETVSALKEQQISSVIISGGIYWLAEKIGATADFREVYANRIKTDARNFIIPDGEIMVEPKHKDIVIKSVQAKLGISPDETISIGDTFQDAAMFRNSGISVAFNPVDRSLGKQTDYTMYGNDLTAILKLLSD